MADTATQKPPTVVELIWEHELVLSGRSGDVKLTVDSAGVEGPSPMQALGFALAACMALDLVHILKKGRHDLRGLKADLIGQRAQDEPRRFTSIELKYTITGNVPEDQVVRAIQLSRDKYCSVWHSMRQDIDLRVSHVISPGV
jgi:putative redox protein